jgi:hypothetical protein
MISPRQRPLPHDTQHSQETNIHATRGIRTHNPQVGGHGPTPETAWPLGSALLVVTLIIIFPLYKHLHTNNCIIIRYNDKQRVVNHLHVSAFFGHLHGGMGFTGNRQPQETQGHLLETEDELLQKILFAIQIKRFSHPTRPSLGPTQPL